ncbi:hypothetical protein QWY96_17675 [Vibrio artabrorum]|uniref:Uncharacterized protein n=1 Tax=Vibrio artabrorum TaxID=446374 RepID=A0ABT8CMR3_9VIBR|nr:hypothetical protein [Vibrio artabrorum]MDN3702280.1 hypothetical protein [Vibrio artabrorum]
MKLAFNNDPCWFTHLDQDRINIYFDGIISLLDDSLIGNNLQRELQHINSEIQLETQYSTEAKLVFALRDKLPAQFQEPFHLLSSNEAFHIKTLEQQTFIVATNSAGLLYGFYQLLSRLSLNQSINDYSSSPQAKFA